MTRILIAFAVTLLAASPAYSQLFCEDDELVREEIDPTYNTAYRLITNRLDYVVFKVRVTPDQSGGEMLIRIREYPYTWYTFGTVTTTANNEVALDGVPVGNAGQSVTITLVEDSWGRQKFHRAEINLQLVTSGLTADWFRVEGEFGTGIEGDFNGSGLVEQGDMDLVLNNWGWSTPSTVDVEWMRGQLPDGVVDQGELDAVLNNWGGTCD